MNIILVLTLLTQQDGEVPAWEPNPGWKIEGGDIERVDKGGNLWTKEEYGDFVLSLEFKLPRGGNSGLLFRNRQNVEHQIEILADAGGRVSTGSGGSVFRRYAPKANMAKPAGEWNAFELEVRGRAVSATYNGTRILENAIVDDLPLRGPIGLQDHGTPLWFRNVQVKRLGKPEPDWGGPPLTAAETRDFMKKLAQFVFDHHLKKDEKSEQRGMVYEYFDTTKKGQLGQWVQGEALDTMHDGAWLATALATAARVTGEPFYEEFLTNWLLPFYLKMLNHSDTLFSANKDDVAPEGHRWNRENQFQEGEKGFVPYFWDDGASVSLEAVRNKTGKPAYSATDRLAGKPNPEFRLDGWSHGSDNHMAQDLAVMLQLAWLLSREKDPKLAAEVAEGAKNLQECRGRHGSGAIPACLAAAGLSNRDAGLLKRIGEPRGVNPDNHSSRCLAPRDPAKAEPMPPMADDQEYHYYAGIARTGGELSRSLAFQLVYDATTHPMLMRYLSDAREVPPGINRFDLGGGSFKGGKPDAYGSDRPPPLGSRFGPQNMVVSGWALQGLKAYPGLWEERYRKQFAADLRVRFTEDSRGYGIDAKPEGGSSEAVTLGDATLRLISHRSALLVSGTAKEDRVTVRVYAQPDAQGSWADVTVRKDRTFAAANDKGESLRVAAHAVSTEDGFAFEFALPYTIVKDQKPWANGIEHFRYTVAVGESRRNFYLASNEDQVVRALTRELGRGLRTWERIFAEKGFIPTGIGRWDSYSDTGGYAHLLKAGAQWLLCLDGKRDWEMHKVPRLE